MDWFYLAEDRYICMHFEFYKLLVTSNIAEEELATYLAGLCSKELVRNIILVVNKQNRPCVISYQKACI
jgi:hypothetical protein